MPRRRQVAEGKLLNVREGADEIVVALAGTLACSNSNEKSQLFDRPTMLHCGTKRILTNFAVSARWGVPVGRACGCSVLPQRPAARLERLTGGLVIGYW
jgi:hypothetical protein